MLFFVHILLKLQRNYSDEHTCLLLAPNRLKQMKQKWTCSAPDKSTNIVIRTK